ncbi:ABC transporter substrate-binding protein, partial [Candidatus Gottesmanbacteria bacterium]|nr:ABC transporter substrate-binding protein [Candidatus Gottesmanbacteria bacterium]
EPKPALATRWEATDSGKQYKFYLKSGLYWHDGKAFTAADVNYNIHGVDFEVLDDYTLRAVLKEAFASLPVLLSRPLFRENLTGLGPYKIESIDLRGDTIKTLELSPLDDSFPKLVLHFYPTENVATTAFKLGEVAILEDFTSAADFRDWKNIKVEERIDHTRYVALFYNTKDQFLSERSHRQALSFAVPTIEEEVATGPISPLSWAYSNKVRQYKFDLAAAKRLLGKDGISTQTASLTLSTFPNYLALAKRIAESWQTLGLSVNVKIENFVPPDYQVFLGSQEIPPDPDQYAYWHSTQDTNITKLDNKRIDKLLEDGRRVQNKEERLKIYTDFQRYLAEEAPATFLFYPKVYTLRRK